MDNTGYEINGLSMFDNNPVDTAINDNPDTVKVYGNQTINGDKLFNGTVTINNEIIHNSTSFSTTDGIIEQLKGNTGDLLDYGNYAEYNDGTSTKYKGIINKKETDKFYIFHNQTNKPSTSLNLGTQDLGTIITRDPVEAQEVATKAYVETHAGGNYLPLTGGIMSGNINMGNNKITHFKSLDFDNSEIYNEITFNESNKLSFTSVNNNGGLVSEYIHLNDASFNKLIELMQDINLHGNINVLDNKRITGLQTPTSNSEPATKEYTDTGLNSKLNLNGGIMNGDINMDTHDVLNANKIGLKPIAPGEPVYLDFTSADSGRGKLFINNIGRFEKSLNEVFTRAEFFVKLQMNDKIYFSSPHKIEGLADGTASGDAVNKSQLDTKLNSSGGTITGNINFSNGIQIKGGGVDPDTISIGIGATPNNKGASSVSLGAFAGQSNQGAGAVAIGGGAGFGTQGENSIAIGLRAGYTGNNSTTYQASNSIILNATGDFLTTPTEDSFIVKPIRNINTIDNILYYNTTSGEITQGVPSFNSLDMNNNKIQNVATPTAGTDAVNKTYVDNAVTGGETIRYINETFDNFNPTGTAHTFIVPFAQIPDGDYYMDINVTLKYLANNANAEGFNMVVHPNYVVNPSADFDYGTNLKLNNVSISSSNNTFGSVNLKWYDTRTSADNNTNFSVTLIYNGGGALNFDVNVRGTVKKI